MMPCFRMSILSKITPLINQRYHRCIFVSAGTGGLKHAAVLCPTSFVLGKIKFEKQKIQVLILNFENYNKPLFKWKTECTKHFFFPT